ncbi:hypothetical protein ABG79_00796 [Caloramator mitchellensis]|uniref:Uncharacterized protein n=1 Tax=Caloramator mitchellensis TaxID=908809 RepID=A0A0R3K3E9_CALMK|nr:hypothetical protein [Caloramator mitchellensis]KRQ87458.1 hypothetical protein ABG79_00796 [Caloramator mitchellensis]
MTFFKLLYNTFIWGLLGAIIAFQNTWLEMRVNIAIFIPVIMIIFTLIFVFLKKVNYLDYKFSITNLLICSILAVLVLGIKRIRIVPASIIREGLGIPSLSFDAVNLSLILILSLILSIICYFEKN